MKILTSFTAIPALLALGATAVAPPHKSVIVSYLPDTPESVIEHAVSSIKAAGGTITHQYSLFKGFAAQAPAEVFESIQSMGGDYRAVVEEDQIVGAYGESSA